MIPRRTPLLPLDAGILLKPEHHQPGGSYKIRGVRRYLANAGLPAAGVRTVSAGNLGRALAAAAAEAGVPAEVFVPDSAPAVKKERIAALGARVTELPFAAVWELVCAREAERGFVHPLRSPELREGYGDIGREIADACPDAGAVVVPFGLGGLAWGVVDALAGTRIPVFAAELDSCAPLAAALAAGAPVRIPHVPSFADAIGTPTVLPWVFEALRGRLAGSVSVTLGETRAALALLAQEGHVVEGAAAVALAAAFRLRGAGRRQVVAVLSGANIEPSAHARETSAAPPL